MFLHFLVKLLQQLLRLAVGLVVLQVVKHQTLPMVLLVAVAQEDL